MAQTLSLADLLSQTKDESERSIAGLKGPELDLLRDEIERFIVSASTELLTNLSTTLSQDTAREASALGSHSLGIKELECSLRDSKALLQEVRGNVLNELDQLRAAAEEEKALACLETIIVSTADADKRLNDVRQQQAPGILEIVSLYIAFAKNRASLTALRSPSSAAEIVCRTLDTVEKLCDQALTLMEQTPLHNLVNLSTPEEQEAFVILTDSDEVHHIIRRGFTEPLLSKLDALALPQMLARIATLFTQMQSSSLCSWIVLLRARVDVDSDLRYSAIFHLCFVAPLLDTVPAMQPLSIANMSYPAALQVLRGMYSIFSSVGAEPQMDLRAKFLLDKKIRDSIALAFQEVTTVLSELAGEQADTVVVASRFADKLRKVLNLFLHSPEEVLAGDIPPFCGYFVPALSPVALTALMAELQGLVHQLSPHRPLSNYQEFITIVTTDLKGYITSMCMTRDTLEFVNILTTNNSANITQIQDSYFANIQGNLMIFLDWLCKELSLSRCDRPQGDDPTVRKNK